jgi:hypothetical protein
MRMTQNNFRDNIHPFTYTRNTPMITRHIKSLAIRCVADEWGATEYEVRKPGITFMVLAHSKQDAEEAVTSALAQPAHADDSQPELLS